MRRTSCRPHFVDAYRHWDRVAAARDPDAYGYTIVLNKANRHLAHAQRWSRLKWKLQRTQTRLDGRDPAVIVSEDAAYGPLKELPDGQRSRQGDRCRGGRRSLARGARTLRLGRPQRRRPAAP